GQLGIGNSHLAEELLGSWRAPVPMGKLWTDAMPKELINEHVNAAQEEASHRCHCVEQLAISEAPFQGAYIGLRYVFIVLQSKEQRDVNGNALVQHVLNGGNACRGARNLDEHVGAVDGLKQPARLLHGAKRIVGQIR